ncbi:hypothetical protein [Luteimonas huabeiensis]|uniref:hypothetical protein n=1 Tax=Luteimonas huabeiensis TaxID=1244513 RepID=UPI0004667379|nr:hypothetical protein [Luteimonas huabeiensis]
MDKVRTSQDNIRGRDRNADAGAKLDRLIGQVEQRASSPAGTALDARGQAPQATCSRFLYCV